MRNAISLALSTSILSSFAVAGEVKVWAWDPNFNVAIMNDAAEIYSQTHPDFSLVVEDSSKDSVVQKLHTSLSSGVTNALPDIVLIEDYNAQKFLHAYPNYFVPLNSYIDYTKFAPYKVELMTIDKKTYGVPFDSGVTGLFYRSDYIQSAGYTHENLVDITWDELIKIGVDVKAKTGKSLLSYDPNDASLIRVMMQSAGAWYFDENGQLNIKDNEALQAALKVIKDLHTNNVIRPITGWPDFVSSFNNGDVVTVPTGVWITATIKSQSSQSGKWQVAPIPKLEVKGAKAASNLGGSSWYVLNTSDNKDQAIDFLNQIYANNDNFYQEILVKNGAVGSYLPAVDGAAYNEPDPYFSNQKVFKDFGHWVAEIPQVNYGMFTYEADDAVKANLNAYIQGHVTLEALLDNVHNQLKFQIQ